MDEHYGARYRELFERHWWWRAREAVILAALRAHRPAGGWRSSLDVGCGDGLFFDALAGEGIECVEGVELAESLVPAASPHREHIHFAPFDSRFDPGRRYDLLLMLDVLEHLDDPLAALRHAARLLRPDGTLVATVPAFMALWTAHDRMNHHVTRFDAPTFAALAENAGFVVVESRYFFRWTALAKLAVRAAERVAPRQPAPPGIPPAPINGALRVLSRLEEQLLGRLPLPFGSSLLVVARAPALQRAVAVPDGVVTPASVLPRASAGN